MGKELINGLLSDDELDKAAGGKTTPNNGSRYGNPGCPGPNNYAEKCFGCSDYVKTTIYSPGPRGSILTTTAYKCRNL